MGRRGLVLALVVVGASGAGLAPSVRAATYTVGTSKDVTGTCASPAAGTCSLRQLIDYEDELAATPSPPDEIVVPAGSYKLTNGELAVTQSIAIVGAGARTTKVVQAGATAARVFDVKASAVGSVPSVVISGLEITGGTAGANNGELGGDIYNSGKLVLEEDWITDGTASSGGGVSNDTGTLLVERSLVSMNHASTGSGDSGGIENHGSEVCGAACFPGKKAILTVEDSTVAENDARLGAGIYSWSDAADGNEVSVIDSTIADNGVREEPGGPIRGPGAGLLVGDGTADVGGSILDADYEAGEEYTPSNCSVSGAGKIVSLGYNMENETDCGFKSTGDLQDTSPEFGTAEPQNNGGATNTFDPDPTSPAVDVIPAANVRCDGADQRGVTRPQGAGCDIGAVELVPFTIEATEGSPFSGTLTNAGCSIEATPTINWGDGQESKATLRESAIRGTHTYEQAGTYYGSVTYEDDCGGHKFPFEAKVADAPLSAKGVSASASAGVQFSGTVATFTDANPFGALPDYTASINWGDGSSTAGAISAVAVGFAVAGTHTYLSGGIYQMSVTITDTGGAEATATGSADVVGPPVVSSVSVISLTETTATISFTIDPDGADTSYVIEYGHSPGYGQSTSPVDIGAGDAPQELTTTLTGLEPGSTYHFEVVATNSQASAGVGGGDEPFNTVRPAGGGGVLGAHTAAIGPATLGSLPPPVLGKTVDVDVVSGKVFVSLPSTGYVSLAGPLETAFESRSKGLKFIPLTEARQIPVGSTLETTAGVARIETATASVGKLQSGDFGAGIFKLLQARKQKGLTELDLIDNHSPKRVCATLGKMARTASKHLSSTVLGRLTGNAHGKFTTRGQYSAATVRGTVWGVRNRCDGTLTRVVRGVVSVRDFRRRKTITLFTGQHYLAKAPS